VNGEHFASRKGRGGTLREEVQRSFLATAICAAKGSKSSFLAKFHAATFWRQSG
jgi:hypothetical protein